MEVSILQQALTDLEIIHVVQETQKFPDLVYISPTLWRRFSNSYCLFVGNELAGVCAIYRDKNWIKIGPLVILERYHHKGYGKMLVQHILEDNPQSSFFISSTNPSVKKIAVSLSFQKNSSMFSLPGQFLLSLAAHSIEYINARIVYEWLRKSMRFHREARNYYIR